MTTSTPPLLHSPRKPWLKRWHRMRETQRTEVQVLDSFASATHLVLSAVQLADWRGERRWQYHVSISVRPPLHVSNDVLALMRLATMFGAAMHGNTRDSKLVHDALAPRPLAGERRATDEEVARILREFDMVGAEEDNHHPGLARHFWRLCELRPGEVVGMCECKEGETQVVEADGYVWSKVPEHE